MDLRDALAVLRLAASAGGGATERELLPGTRVGRYEIVGKRLARGGSGDVYPATDALNGGRLALKYAHSNSPAAIRAFDKERYKALLNHSSILAAHDSGVHEGYPYLVFRRLEGHLRQNRRKHYATPEAILRLMLTVVDAVGFAHGRAVLHCDLKPENLLFDESGAPHVSDFGLARDLEASGSSGEAWGGTRGWMSPEQVRKGDLGVESDVFTLGVLLYWLLSEGRLPFGKGDDFERRVLEEDPEPLAPRSQRPGWWPSSRQRGHFAATLSWDLAAICRKALQKAPGDRYRSAAELRRDLERADEGRLPAAAEPLIRPGRRLLRSAQRHPWLAFGGLLALTLPPYVISIQNDALKELRSAFRPQSRFSALAQAQAVVSQLYGMALRVHAMSKDPSVFRLVEHGGISKEAPALEPHVTGFDSVNVFSADGAHQARWPAHPRGSGPNVGYSDHFACAQRIASALLEHSRSDSEATLPVCVARAHRSLLDGRVKLGMSAPLVVSGRFVGVVEGSTMARDSFGALQMSCGPGDCFTALLGPRDRDAPGDTLPATLSVLAQRGLEVGDEQRLPVEVSGRICRRVGCTPDPLQPFGAKPSEPLEIELFEDPLSGASTVAVVAPVAHTGLSVLIATPYSSTSTKLAVIASAAYRHLWLPPVVAVVAWLLLLLAPNPRWPWPAKPTPPGS